MTTSDFLNARQREAVTAALGPVLVLAGPGSGKTRVLIQRIAYLIHSQHVPPWQVMAVTFTNKAAREMRERLEKIVERDLRGMLMGTFHASCARILRIEAASITKFGYDRDFVIFDSDDQRQVVKAAMRELNIDEKRFQPNRLLGQISRAKDSLITPEIYEATDYLSAVVRRVYEQYQRTLVANNAMDFDDLLLNTVRLFDEFPEVLAKYQQQYRHILVDEFQDTNTVQYALLTRLAQVHRNLFVVGDSDQSIYKWRGADYRNIDRFRQEFPGAQQVLLEENYRSTQIILDAAKAVIRKNSNRVHKELFTARKGGPKLVLREAYNETEEADQIVTAIASGVQQHRREPGDYAVMYRTNAQSRSLEEAFVRAGLPYRIVGATRFYSRREVKDILSYLRLIHNPRDNVALTRAINTPSRGIGAKTQQLLLAWGAQNGLQGGEQLVQLVADPTQKTPFSTRQLRLLVSFGTLLSDWIGLRGRLSAGELTARVLADIKYEAFIDDGSEEGRDRWQNVLELLRVADAEPDLTLDAFLEHVALVAEADRSEGTVNAPTLLTLHASKGLEFPIVFITGLEEGLLPHSRALEDAEEMAEERRLFYVGLTRAKDKVYLSHAFRRSRYGASDAGTPSRFLSDLPPELVEGGSQLAKRHQQAQQRMTSWHWSDEETQVSPLSDSYRSFGRRSNVKRSQGSTAKGLPTPRHFEEEAESPKEAQAQYRPGQKVRHSKFGAGTVLESKVKRGDEEVTIVFPDHGIKRLAASFAKLEVVDGD